MVQSTAKPGVRQLYHTDNEGLLRKLGKRPRWVSQFRDLEKVEITF